MRIIIEIAEQETVGGKSTPPSTREAEVTNAGAPAALLAQADGKVESAGFLLSAEAGTGMDAGGPPAALLEALRSASSESMTISAGDEWQSGGAAPVVG